MYVQNIVIVGQVGGRAFKKKVSYFVKLTSLPIVFWLALHKR